MSNKQPQLDKFKAAAKEAGCDTRVRKFDAALSEIAKSPKRAVKAKPAPKTKD